MHPSAIVTLLCLLAVANGTPVLAKRLAGDVLAYPIDRGFKWRDGQPLLGSSKTVRGLVLAILATAVCSPLLDLEWRTGAIVGGAAMAGDMFSSFVKRRMRLPASSRATGLDQIPESLLPLLVIRLLLPLTVLDITAIVGAFVIGEMLLSRVLYAWHVRDQPY
ncbi:MAG: CDP-archaeol synthase [Vicinamibacterales bacterium]